MKPRWVRYRSSKWFELMMLESAIRTAFYGMRSGVWCPFCSAMNWELDFVDACARCPFGPEVDGCMRLERLSKSRYQIASFDVAYGVTWRQAYPEIARVGRNV